MCQLLGVSSNKRVDIGFSLREFQHRGRRNHHGWGFAFYQDGDWKIIKEPSSLAEKDIKDEGFHFRSKMIIGHVRLASCGSQGHLNTHPFKNNKWVFAHNGTVSRIMKDPQFALTAFKPVGKTDSEYAFCYLLEKISAGFENIKEVLQAEALKIRQYGNFNFLLSDGETLFAHGDNSLYYVQRKAPFNAVSLIDDQCSVNLGEIKAQDEKAVIIATEPLTANEKWKGIQGIRIFRNGEAQD